MLGVRKLSTLTNFGGRLFSSKSLKDTLRDQIPSKQAQLMEIRSKYGKQSLGSYTLSQCLDGGHKIPAMFGENLSCLDTDSPEKELKYRNHTLESLIATKLPVRDDPMFESGIPVAEGMLWLLLTSEIPTLEQVNDLNKDLYARSFLPPHVEPLLHSLPSNMGVLAKLSIGILACQTDSKFVQAYKNGARKPEFWDATLEDILDIIAKLPLLVAIINPDHTMPIGQKLKTSITTNKYYNNFNHDMSRIAKSTFPDYAARLTHMLMAERLCLTQQKKDRKYNVMEHAQTAEFVRLFLISRSDKVGLSDPFTHALHLTNCTLADPYKALSTGIHVLAGPVLNHPSRAPYINYYHSCMNELPKQQDFM